MIRGLYTATSGMTVQQKRQENIANNLANAETPSFKKQTLLVKSDDEVNVIKSEKTESETIGSISLGSEIDGVKTDFSQGLITETGKELDYAIDGNAFFQIVDETGQNGFSRNGSLNIDGLGNLINSQGHYLIGKNALNGLTEKINLLDTEFNIKGDGRIIDRDNNLKYSMIISDFSNYDDLENLGNGVYINNKNTEVTEGDFRLIQGFKENSNVNVLDEMVKMIEISRAFESNQRVVQSIDQMLSKAVNEVGKL
ncbi:MAG: flagellar hook-basal body complex protein [Bacillota bacterium]|nr:flagellar hook-basal body complex protein [Bacillota bacterium]